MERIAKYYSSNDLDSESVDRCIGELRQALSKLPKSYYTVVAEVMRHLHRIASQCETNNMSAYNLAVIFGPTLLHCLRESMASESGSRAALVDSTHQIHAIEIMITWAGILFAADEATSDNNGTSHTHSQHSHQPNFQLTV